MNRAPDERANEAEEQALLLERLVFFSDAVFAIAITLLALDIRLPEGSDTLSASELRDALIALSPQYLSYMLSFLVIGIFWRSHHAKFRIVKRFDQGLFWLNLLLLMVIAFIPFSTSVLSSNASSTATIFYALTIASAGIASGLINVYATRGNRLVRDGLTFEERWRGPMLGLLTAFVFLLSIPIALFDADLAKYSWLLLAPLMFLVGRALFGGRGAPTHENASR